MKHILPAAAALILLVSCVTNQPDNKLSVLYFNLGDAYFRLEEYKKSVSSYETALLYDKTNNSIKYNLAHAYVKNGQLAEALQLVNELLRKDPENGFLLETKAYILLKNGYPEEAKTLYQKILELVPNHLNALYNSYLIAHQQENHTEAFSFLESYYRFADKDGDAYFLLGDTAGAAGLEDRKISFYEEGAKLGHIKSLEYLAVYYEEHKEFEKAISKYQALEKTKDYNFRFYMQMAKIFLFDIEDFSKGKEYLKIAKEHKQLDINLIAKNLDETEYLWENELKDYLDTLK